MLKLKRAYLSANAVLEGEEHIVRFYKFFLKQYYDDIIGGKGFDVIRNKNELKISLHSLQAELNWDEINQRMRPILWLKRVLSLKKLHGRLNDIMNYVEVNFKLNPDTHTLFVEKRQYKLNTTTFIHNDNNAEKVVLNFLKRLREVPGKISNYTINTNSNFRYAGDYYYDILELLLMEATLEDGTFVSADKFEKDIKERTYLQEKIMELNDFQERILKGKLFDHQHRSETEFWFNITITCTQADYELFQSHISALLDVKNNIMQTDHMDYVFEYINLNPKLPLDEFLGDGDDGVFKALQDMTLPRIWFDDDCSIPFTPYFIHLFMDAYPFSTSSSEILLRERYLLDDKMFYVDDSSNVLHLYSRPTGVVGGQLKSVCDFCVNRIRKHTIGCDDCTDSEMLFDTLEII